MPAKKRTQEESTSTDESKNREYVMIVVSAPEIPCVDNFLVPVDRLGKDHDAIMEMITTLDQEDAWLPTDPREKLDGRGKTLFRLGVRLGVLANDSDDDDDDDPQPDAPRPKVGSDETLHDTKLAKAGFTGNIAHILVLQCG